MKKNTLVCFLLLVVALTSAQQKEVTKANNAFENYAFIDAISIYEKVVEKGFGSAPIYKKLAESYYANANYSIASKWYEHYFTTTTDTIDANTYLRYYQSLKSLGNVKKSVEILEIFAQIHNEDSRAKKFLSNRNFIEKIDLNSNAYEVKNEEHLNSELSDFGSGFLNDNLVFSSTRNTKENTKSTNKWNNQPYTSLYLQQADEIIDFSLDNTNKYNISSAIFTKDGQTVYYTKNFINKTKNTKIGNLKMYSAQFINGKWTDEKELSFNGNYNCAHPALDEDEKYLYFVSDMPGTLGLSDIFKVEILSKNTFSTPINLGKSINTEGRETFPFIDENGTIYFSSDGHLGHGGLDIFYGEYNSKDNEYSVYNIGTPINSAFDDFAYSKRSSVDSGYFSSNRPNGKGFDDIYSFTIIKNELLGETSYDLSQIKVQSGTDLAKLFDLKDIYFEKSEWEIATDEISKLQILFEILQQNPNLKIDIRAHTDSRASETYNLNLSQKRADATKKWLVEKGIDQNRLKATGYGENHLLNNCKDGVPCSEVEHKINRRSEFIILFQ